MNGKEGSLASGLVMVVDDDPMLREAVCHILNKAKYRTIQAKNGEEALQLFETSRPVAMITDFSMPKLDGEQLIHKVRAVDASLPILMITGEAPDLTILNLVKYRRFIALHKPFDGRTLLQSLEQVLRMPAESDGSERRRSYRLETQMNARMEPLGDVQVTNLSLDGLFIVTPSKMAIGTPVTVTLTPLKNMVLQGKVMWLKGADNSQKGAAGIGIQFVAISPANHTTIKNYILKEIKQRGIGFVN